jgi:mannose-6-phosphate isomerase-like protein (cupin superfamily)
MKIISKEQTVIRMNSDLCRVTEYEMGDPDLDFASVTISGRYPDAGRVTNTQCKEIVYIHVGNGNVEVEGKNYPLKAGDLVLIDAGEKFYWDGNMTLFISCNPAFTIEQHQLVA